MIRLILLMLVLLPWAEAVSAQPSDPTARGRAWLRAQQRDDGAIADRRNPLFETWETILAAHALRTSTDPADRRALDAALAFLATQAGPQGTLCHNRRCLGATCIETTAEYWRLRRLADDARVPASVLGAVRSLQQPDGRFRIGNPDVVAQTDFPSVTAFALTLVAADRRSRVSGAHWLRRAQDDRGLFGVAWEYYGTEAYAAWAVAGAWAGDRRHANDAARTRLRDRLVATQTTDGSWPAPAGDGSNVSAELVSALSMLALQSLDPGSDALPRARAWLLSRQAADGHWPGGRFPVPAARYLKAEDVAATAWALQALEGFR